MDHLPFLEFEAGVRLNHGGDNRVAGNTRRAGGAVVIDQMSGLRKGLS
jgi:hypothetical protein